MKALVYGGPWTMTLEEVPDPQPGPGELLVEPCAVGICGSDVHGFIGKTGRRKPPMIMGHEFSGRVTGVGRGRHPLRHWGRGRRLAHPGLRRRAPTAGSASPTSAPTAMCWAWTSPAPTPTDW